MDSSKKERIYIGLDVPVGWDTCLSMQPIIEGEILGDRWSWHRSVPEIPSPLFEFDPILGHREPYPSEVQQYRRYFPGYAWLYNPYTGELRDPRDIASDVYGHLIQK
jgi:hypothetical protein